MALRPSSPQDRERQLAERQAAQSSAFLREVDDALREDTAKTLFLRYRKPVGIAVAGALALLAGGLFWNNARQDSANKRAETFILALDRLDAGDTAAASAQLQPIAASGGDGTQAAARVLQAGIAEKAGKTADADRLFAAVAADSSAPQPYRNLATVRDVALRFDAMAPADVVARLHPLAVPGNPWFGSAGELTGLAYLKEGKNDLAAPLFREIARDATVPETLRNRARQMASLLGQDTLDDATGAADAASAAH